MLQIAKYFEKYNELQKTCLCVGTVNCHNDFKCCSINFHKQKMQPAKYRHLDITPFSMDEINYIKLLDVIAKINRTFRNSLLFLRKLQFSADLVTFTEEILNGKLHFLFSEKNYFQQKKHAISTVEKEEGHCDFSHCIILKRIFKTVSRRNL